MDLQAIIQGGAVGLSVLLIFLVYKIVQMLYKISGNHIQHSNKTMIENTKALVQLQDAIRELRNFLGNGRKKK